MNPEQLKALELSISHWDRVCMGVEPSNGGQDCACCTQFSNFNCRGCPIADTYGSNCTSLGYHKYSKLHPVWHTIPENRTIVFVPACDYWLGIETAELVLTNLLAILPPNHKWKNQGF